MLVDKIIKGLTELGVYAYEITDTVTHGWEFYFIRHKLDQNRAKDVEHINVTVYQMTDGMMGSASAEVPPTATHEETKKILEDLAYKATLVKNKPYALRPAAEKAADPAEKVDVAAIAKDFMEAMNALPETATEDVNSYEIFVNEETKRFISSNGIDITQTYPSSMIEVVINARKEGHEIELYRNYRSGSCDKEGLIKELIRTMQYGKDRLNTVPTPNLGKINVLFHPSDARSIYYYFLSNLDVSAVVRRMSRFTLGTPIAEDMTGDKVTIRALRYLPNSSDNQEFDPEGGRRRDLLLMQDATPKSYIGNAMFSDYLGVQDTFIPSNIEVEGGERTEEELRQGDYLEPVEFSAFHVDGMTGDIFGEIRLAYLHQNGEVKIVSGGSVSGSMRDFVKDMQFSKETVQNNTMKIPAVTVLKNVIVSGINE